MQEKQNLNARQAEGRGLPTKNKHILREKKIRSLFTQRAKSKTAEDSIDKERSLR